MTIVVQFEMKNWFAEGVAVMCPSLSNEPVMQDALARIAKKNGFDRVVEFERETPYENLHKMIDESN